MEVYPKRKRHVQYWSALAASSSSLCLAATATWPSPVLYKFRSKEIHFQVTDKEISWFLATSPIGLLIGSALSRNLADNFGRKTAILISSLPMIVGSFIALIGWNAWFLHVARFVWGVGTGVAGTIIPMYIAEISAKDIRGRLMTLSRVLGNLGSLMMIAGGPFVSYRHINMFLCVLPLVYLAACCFIPESPYYYLKCGRTSDAKRVMLVLQETKDMKSVSDAVSSMQAHANDEMSRGSSVRELVTGRLYRKPLIISAGLKVTEILSGVGTVKQYIGGIAEESGIPMDISTVFIIFGVINFIISLGATTVVDLFRRRTFFIVSSLSLGVTLFVVGIYFYLQEFTRMSAEALYPYVVVAFIGIVTSNVISTVGLAPMSCVIPAEIFALNVKSIALSVVSMFAAILGSTVALSYQLIKDSWGLCGVFWFYSAVASVGGVFTFALLPETKGKTLEEIQMEIQGHPNRKTVRGDDVESEFRVRISDCEFRKDVDTN